MTHTHNQGEAATFIPYRIRTDGDIEIFLQRRDKGIPHAADKFALFGGGIEAGETPEMALLREIREELAYTPRAYTFLGTYGDGQHERIKHVYAEEVAGNFEHSVTVLEGQYGTFMTATEMLQSDELAPGLHTHYPGILERLMRLHQQ